MFFALLGLQAINAVAVPMHFDDSEKIDVLETEKLLMILQRETELLVKSFGVLEQIDVSFSSKRLIGDVDPELIFDAIESVQQTLILLEQTQNHDAQNYVAKVKPAIDSLSQIYRSKKKTSSNACNPCFDTCFLIEMNKTLMKILKIISCGFSNIECFTGFSEIESLVENLTTVVEVCCFTVNSKLDVISESIPVFESCCFTVISKLDDVDADIINCCSAINSNVDQCCFTLNSKIDILEFEDLCQAFPIISQTILTTPGRYCLANDLMVMSSDPVITISSSNIVLDLNGIALIQTGTGNAIKINANLSNIIIENGFIETTTNVNIGIDLSGGGNSAIEINNVHIQGFSLGIWAQDITNSRIGNSIIQSSSDTNLLLDSNAAGTINIEIYNCQSNNCLEGAGINIESCAQISILNCIANNNKTDGIAIGNGACCTIKNSQAHENGSSGFNIAHGQNISLENNEACSNTKVGFLVLADANLLVPWNACLTRCIAKNNACGFEIGECNPNAFRLQNGLIKECVASQNSTVGFFDTDDGTNRFGIRQYVSNVGINNGINYAGPTAAIPSGFIVNMLPPQDAQTSTSITSQWQNICVGANKACSKIDAIVACIPITGCP